MQLTYQPLPAPLRHIAAALRVFFGLTALVDDGIVVDEVKKGVTSMFPVRVLRERLGADGMAELHTVVNDAGRQWKEDVLAITAERFERRLAEEIGALRVDMGRIGLPTFPQRHRNTNRCQDSFRCRLL